MATHRRIQKMKMDSKTATSHLNAQNYAFEEGTGWSNH